MHPRSPQPPSKKGLSLAVFVIPLLVVGGMIGLFILHSNLSQSEQERLDRAEEEKIQRYFQKRPAGSQAPRVDGAAIDREALSKCDEGLALIQKHRSSLQGNAKADLMKGKSLIEEGLQLLNRPEGPCADVSKYQEALRTARKALSELQ